MRISNFLLICYHTTSDAVPGVPGRIGFHVVSLCMDNQRRSAVAEKRVAVGSPIHVSVHQMRSYLSVSVHREILHVARVVAFRIFEPVLLAVRIEMGASWLEI